MPYKTILVHVDHSSHAGARIALAAQLALEHGAHLIGAAMLGLSRVVDADAALDLASTLMAAQLARMGEQAREALARFEEIAARHGVRSLEARLVEDDTQSGLTCQARYADLVILSQFDPGDAAARPSAGLAEHVLMGAARPLLVVPHAASVTPPRRVLVAWNGSRACTRALADALPLLLHAEHVTLAQVNPPPESEAARLEVARYLRRHGIGAVDHAPARAGHAVGQHLLHLAARHGCDLLVCGGHGHTRLRELVLGSVTDRLLKAATLPLLMSH